MAAEQLRCLFMEFLGNFDTLAGIKRWKEVGFRDVTPRPPGVTQEIVKFNTPAVALKWPQFQQAVANLPAKEEPDWCWISGHHGRQKSSDWDGNESSWPNHIATEKKVGFFNKAYHDFAWPNGNPLRPQQIFMTTTRQPTDPQALAPTDNPLFTKVRDQCKGVVLIGCYSLGVYNSERETYKTMFPNALLIGLSFRTDGLRNQVAPLLDNTKIFDQDFYRSPKTDLQSLAKYCYYLNLHLHTPATINLQYGDRTAGYDSSSHTATAADESGNTAVFPTKSK